MVCILLALVVVAQLIMVILLRLLIRPDTKCSVSQRQYPTSMALRFGSESVLIGYDLLASISQTGT